MQIKDFTLNDIKNIDHLLKTNTLNMNNLVISKNLNKKDIYRLKINMIYYPWLFYSINDDLNTDTTREIQTNFQLKYDLIEWRQDYSINSQIRVLKEQESSSLIFSKKINFILWQNFNKHNIDTLSFMYYNEYNSYKMQNSCFYDTLFINKSDYLTIEDVSDIILNEKFIDLNDSYFLFQKYNYSRISSFIQFFIENQINIPNNFKKIKSLKRKSNSLPLLKLINCLMRSGKKEQYSKYFFQTLSFLYSNLNFKDTFKLKQKNNLGENFIYNWKTFKSLEFDWLKIYLIMNNVFNYYDYEIESDMVIDDDYKFVINYNNMLSNDGKLINEEFFIKNFLMKKFSSITPVFTHFVLNVDKKIRKFSRGKSGKYKLIWKYVVNYKRLGVVLRTIKRTIKFENGKKFKNRIFLTFLNLFLNFNDNFLWKSKFFAHNYIFKNYRKTLMQTLKSVK